MQPKILTTGIAGRSFKRILRSGLSSTRPKAIGIAVAYVSVAGFDYIKALVDALKIKHLRLVTDTRDAITHPLALARALNEGWDVRVIDHLSGTFHPKLFIGGSTFNDDSGVADICFVVVGSANLSAAALNKNGECSYVCFGDAPTVSAGVAWKECWDIGSPLNEARLAQYEAYFAARNRHRRVADLVALGVSDGDVPKTDGKPRKFLKAPPPKDRAIANTVATTAWTGLQSFTGEYDLQVEFPKDAGEVLARILKQIAVGDKADLLCDDGQTRQFIFRFYRGNGMWRLNVPNSTPNAPWARQHKDGIAVVEGGSGAIRFRIIKSGSELLEIADRSMALGTWGKTSKRLYGWY
jgi:hypothetical protein